MAQTGTRDDFAEAVTFVGGAVVRHDTLYDAAAGGEDPEAALALLHRGEQATVTAERCRVWFERHFACVRCSERRVPGVGRTLDRRGDQADRLVALGCHLAQGYHFARPAPPDEIEPLLAERAIASGLAVRTAQAAPVV